MDSRGKRGRWFYAKAEHYSSEWATKSDLAELRKETKEEFAKLESRLNESGNELDACMNGIVTKLTTILDKNEAKNAAEREAFEKTYESVRNDSRTSRNRVIGTCIAIIGLIVTAVGFAAGVAITVIASGNI